MDKADEAVAKWLTNKSQHDPQPTQAVLVHGLRAIDKMVSSAENGSLDAMDALARIHLCVVMTLASYEW